MQLKPLLASLAVATAALFGMSDAEAKRIGYTTNCWGGVPSAQIELAGHTAVALNTSFSGVTAEALVGLDGLFSSDCPEFSAINPSVESALANGLVLWLDNYWGSQYPHVLPGNRTVTHNANPNGVTLPMGAAWATGPGGTVSVSSLNAAPSYSGMPIASLPADMRVMATDQSGTQARVVSYAVGRGRVVYSTFATGCMLQGGACGGDPLWIPSFPGLYALTTNLFAWAQPAFTTCAAEGYTGSKLTLCRSVCETTQSSTTLTSKIRLYTAIYRETPPCAL